MAMCFQFSTLCLGLGDPRVLGLGEEMIFLVVGVVLIRDSAAEDLLVQGDTGADLEALEDGLLLVAVVAADQGARFAVVAVLLAQDLLLLMVGGEAHVLRALLGRRESQGARAEAGVDRIFPSSSTYLFTLVCPPDRHPRSKGSWHPPSKCEYQRLTVNGGLVEGSLFYILSRNT